jgi:hypothetical protein
MAHSDIRLSQLLRVYIDGIPLDLASKLLPGKSRFHMGLLAHIFLHANAQKRYSDQAPAAVKPGAKMSRLGLTGLIDNLESTTRDLKWAAGGTEWGDCYDSTNYTREAFDRKAEIIKGFLAEAKPARVWDLGANTGVFSRLASDQGIMTVASDIDPTAVDKNYRQVREKKEKLLLPLVIDLTNPSPALGWQNNERDAFIDRGPVDLVMALALVHHLAISNNVPLANLSSFFARLGRWLIIEFVPKEDSQVQRLLSSREDIFPDYTREGFEQAFKNDFQIRKVQEIEGSKRLLYLMESRS